MLSNIFMVALVSVQLRERYVHALPKQLLSART